MKAKFHFCLLAVAVCVAGCRDNASKPAEGDAKHKDDDGITFKPKAGLSVPEDVAQHIGLKLADVSERKINRQLAFTAQVYGESGPQARRVTLASAWMEPALAQTIPAGTELVAIAADTNSLTGVVSRVIPTAYSNAPAEVLLEFAAGQGELKLGDFVRVTVTTPGKADVTVIPRAALVQTHDGHFVYVANGKHLLRAPVRVGGEQDGFVEIRSGLLAGDKIAVAGVALLRLAELHHVNGGDACTGNH